MSAAGGRISLAPGFLSGRRGRLFCVHIAPVFGPPRGAVLFAPALADEQNKSRHIVSAVARRLAAHGIAVLLIDPYGTGDSEGEFGAVGWPDWVEDLQSGLAALRSRTDVPVVLWAMRGGALLAAMLASRSNEHLCGLVLWNPVLRGAQVRSELIRLRSASALTARGGVAGGREPGAASADATLAAAGYEWSAALLAGLEQVDLVEVWPDGLPVWWLDTARNPDRGPGPAVHRAMERLRGKGCTVEHQALPGASFWNSVELEWPRPLMDATVARLQGVFP